MSNQIRYCSYIWMCGNQLDLISNIRAYLLEHHGKDSVDGMDKFFWHNIELSILHSHALQMTITAPSKVIEDQPFWNFEIQEFFDQVVRPLADKASGAGRVSVGLVQGVELNALKLKPLATIEPFTRQGRNEP